MLASLMRAGLASTVLLPKSTLIFQLPPLTGLVQVIVVAAAGVAAPLGWTPTPTMTAAMPASSCRFIRRGSFNAIVVRLAKFRSCHYGVGRCAASYQFRVPTCGHHRRAIY